MNYLAKYGFKLFYIRYKLKLKFRYQKVRGGVYNVHDLGKMVVLFEGSSVLSACLSGERNIEKFNVPTVHYKTCRNN
jgi:hypothetical protein